MEDTNFKNNHLKQAIKDVKNYLDNGEEPPMEDMFSLIYELNVSNLLIPAVVKEDDFEFAELVEDETDESYIPLFTDKEEFEKYYGDDSEFEPIGNIFEFYKLILESEDFDGIVINVAGDFLPIDKELVDTIPSGELSFEEYEDAYGSDKLKEIFETVNNEYLSEFLLDWKNVEFEQLMVNLSNSTLLNLIVAGDEFSDSDDIIECGNGDVELCTIDIEGKFFVPVFTSKDMILNSVETDGPATYFGQVTILSKLFDFVLYNDMEGVIINPGVDDFFISRDLILPQASGVEIIVEKPELSNSLDYAFRL